MTAQSRCSSTSLPPLMAHKRPADPNLNHGKVTFAGSTVTRHAPTVMHPPILMNVFLLPFLMGSRTGCTPNAASFSGWDANLAVLERQAYTRTDRTRCGSWSEAGTPSRARRGKPRQTYIDDPVSRPLRVIY